MRALFGEGVPKKGVKLFFSKKGGPKTLNPHIDYIQGYPDIQHLTPFGVILGDIFDVEKKFPVF